MRRQWIGFHQAGVLRNERPCGERIFGRVAVTRLRRQMDQAALPKPGTRGVDVYRSLDILHERAAGLDAARRHVLIGARRIKVKEQAVTGEICAQTAPVAGELGAFPDVAEFCAGESKYRPIVEKGQESRGQIDHRCASGWCGRVEMLKTA